MYITWQATAINLSQKSSFTHTDAGFLIKTPTRAKIDSMLHFMLLWKVKYIDHCLQVCCVTLQVKLVNGSHKIGLDAYTESGEWQIIRTEASSGDQFYESDPGVPFPRVRFTLFLRRKPMFYMINIITPCITMSLLALLVFYLPPDSGEKVSLGITVLLSFSVFLLLVAENVPKTSEFVPLLGKRPVGLNCQSVNCHSWSILCHTVIIMSY